MKIIANNSNKNKYKETKKEKASRFNRNTVFITDGSNNGRSNTAFLSR